MKITLRTVQLAEASFRHAVDPLGTSERKNGPGDAQMEIELAKGEQPTNFAIKLKTTVDNPQSAYVIRVTYAAIVDIDPEGKELPEDIERRVMVTGANILFPFCRELVANLSQRSRFGPLWLQPVNFNNLFAKSDDVAATPAAHGQ